MKPVTALTKVPSISSLLKDDPFFERVQEMHELIARRAYELFERSRFSFGRDLDDWFRAESELLHSVPIEVEETEDQFTMRAEVPGFREKDLDIKVDPHRVFITGNREEASEKKKKGKLICAEQSSERIFREYYLPAEIDPDKVTSELKDGVLELELPKAAQAKKVAVEEAA